MAVQNCNFALSINPQHVKSLYRRAQGYRFLELFEEALNDLDSVLQLDEETASNTQH